MIKEQAENQGRPRALFELDAVVIFLPTPFFFSKMIGFKLKPDDQQNFLNIQVV